MKGATTNASWICSPNILIIKTSRSFTCVWDCFEKIVGRHLWTKMPRDSMDWVPLRIVYKLIRKTKYSWIVRYLSWYNETAFSDLLWTLEREAWQMMMDPDVLRNLPPPVNPAGVGSSTSNQASPSMVSPGTIREILDTGDPNIIDDAFEQWSAADIYRYLASIPTPPPITVSPVGVGSTASNLSPSPGLPRTPTDAVAGAGGGGSLPGSSAGSRSGSSTGSRGRGRGRGSTPQGSRRASTPQGSRRGSTPQGPSRASMPQGLGRASTPRGRPQQAQKQPRG